MVGQHQQAVALQAFAPFDLAGHHTQAAHQPQLAGKGELDQAAGTAAAREWVAHQQQQRHYHRSQHQPAQPKSKKAQRRAEHTPGMIEAAQPLSHGGPRTSVVPALHAQAPASSTTGNGAGPVRAADGPARPRQHRPVPSAVTGSGSPRGAG